MSRKKNFRDKLDEIEKQNQQILDKKRKSSKCYRCVWGKWLENKYYCMFPKCQK